MVHRHNGVLRSYFKNKDDLQELIQSDFQEWLLRKQSAKQCRIVCHTSCKKEDKDQEVHKVPLLCSKEVHERQLRTEETGHPQGVGGKGVGAGQSGNGEVEPRSGISE